MNNYQSDQQENNGDTFAVNAAGKNDDVQKIKHDAVCRCSDFFPNAGIALILDFNLFAFFQFFGFDTRYKLAIKEAADAEG